MLEQDKRRRNTLLNLAGLVVLALFLWFVQSLDSAKLIQALTLFCHLGHRHGEFESD